MNIPNLVKLEPMDTCYDQCKVHGKLVRPAVENEKLPSA